MNVLDIAIVASAVYMVGALASWWTFLGAPASIR